MDKCSILPLCNGFPGGLAPWLAHDGNRLSDAPFIVLSSSSYTLLAPSFLLPEITSQIKLPTLKSLSQALLLQKPKLKQIVS